MKKLNSTLSFSSAAVSFGGAIISQVTQSPTVTVGTIVVSVIGVLALWLRLHYSLTREKLDVHRLRTEVEVYRAVIAKQKPCPFSATGQPACAEPDKLDSSEDRNDLE